MNNNIAVQESNQKTKARIYLSYKKEKIFAGVANKDKRRKIRKRNQDIIISLRYDNVSAARKSFEKSFEELYAEYLQRRINIKANYFYVFKGEKGQLFKKIIGASEFLIQKNDIVLKEYSIKGFKTLEEVEEFKIELKTRRRE